MIPQAEISKLAFREGMSDKVIEKDYVITWILLALADSELEDFLVFKGGTALEFRRARHKRLPGVESFFFPRGIHSIIDFYQRALIVIPTGKN